MANPYAIGGMGGGSFIGNVGARSNNAGSRNITPGIQNNQYTLSNPSAGHSFRVGNGESMQSFNNRMDQQRSLVDDIMRDTPKVTPLPAFNTAANWAKAQGQATSTVNPKYQDMLNNYLRDVTAKRTQQTTQADMDKKATATRLSQLLEDTAGGRARTAEDTTNTLADITGQEDTFQTQEGRAFDTARNALMGNISDSGLTESGLGQGQVANAVTDRNIASEAQTDQFDQGKRDTQLAFNRKMSDLDTADVRGKSGAASANKQTDFDLQSYLTNSKHEEDAKRYDLNDQRQQEINKLTTGQYNTLVQQALASISDPAQQSMFKQIYGR